MEEGTEPRLATHWLLLAVLGEEGPGLGPPTPQPECLESIRTTRSGAGKTVLRKRPDAGRELRRWLLEPYPATAGT